MKKKIVRLSDYELTLIYNLLKIEAKKCPFPNGSSEDDLAKKIKKFL